MVSFLPESRDSRSGDGNGPNTGSDVGRPGTRHRQGRTHRRTIDAAHADRAKETRPGRRADLSEPGRLRHTQLWHRREPIPTIVGISASPPASRRVASIIRSRRIVTISGRSDASIELPRRPRPPCWRRSRSVSENDLRRHLAEVGLAAKRARLLSKPERPGFVWDVDSDRGMRPYLSGRARQRSTSAADIYFPPSAGADIDSSCRSPGCFPPVDRPDRSDAWD